MDPVTRLPFDRFSFRVGRIGVRQFKCVAFIVFRIHREHGKLATAQPVNAMVGGNRKQPGRKWTFLIIAMQVLERTQKCYLRGIFRQLRFAEHAIAKVKDRGLIGFDEFGKCLIAALLSLENPGCFFVHACSSYELTILLYARISRKLHHFTIWSRPASSCTPKFNGCDLPRCLPDRGSVPTSQATLPFG